jgi:hypothetical protein
MKRNGLRIARGDLRELFSGRARGIEFCEPKRRLHDARMGGARVRRDGRCQRVSKRFESLGWTTGDQELTT